jgi:hypothetical protein
MMDSSRAAPYDTDEGPKQECRQTFIEAIARHIPEPRNFLMLPSKHAHDAVLVSHRWPKARIIGVERDIAIFEHIDRTYPNIVPFRGTVGEYLASHIDLFRAGRLSPFDASFLDYTGQASPANVADVCELAAHFTRPVSLIGLTFTKHPRHEAGSVESMVHTSAFLSEEETYGQANWNTSLNVANAICGCLEGGMEIPDRRGVVRTVPGIANCLRSLEILHHQEYRSVERSVLMYFIILKVEKFS